MRSRSEREEKFDRIYQAYEKDVFKIAMNYLHDENAASDITQEVFCHFHNRMDDICDEAVKAYVIAAARHLAFNYVRDEKHEVQSEDIEVEAVKKEIPAESAEEICFRNERRKQEIKLGAEIFEALREKNELWYEVMYMAFADDKSYEEIAEELGVSKQVLYCRVYRARDWIQKKYGHRFKDIEAFT